MHEKQIAEKLAREAGRIMLKHFSLGLHHDIKEDKTRVTVADTLINTMVLEEINKEFPSDSVIGEEESALKDSSRVWIVDPIDGTDPFSRGVPTNVFSLALVEDGVPILGAVYDPYQDRLYSAEKGKGAQMNGNAISTSSKQDLDHSAIESGGFKRFKTLDFIETMRGLSANVYCYKCTVYAHMMVASGQLESALYLYTKPWDVAAAKIIVEEAGGVTSDLYGAPQRYDGDVRGFVASGNAVFHENILKALKPSV